MFENPGVKRLTIEDIETKQFRLAARGYEQREVDEFLDSICDEMELLQGEVESLKRKLEMAKAETRRAEAAGGVVRPADTGAADGSFQEILAMAHRVKEQTISDAETKAAEIVANAETEVNARLGGLTEEKVKLEATVSTLKAAASEYKTRFERLIREHKEILDRLALDD